MKTLLKILMWIAIIALVIFLTLFIAAKVSGLGTIGELLGYLRQQI